jgi:hypothetical protein
MLPPFATLLKCAELRRWDAVPLGSTEGGLLRARREAVMERLALCVVCAVLIGVPIGCGDDETNRGPGTAGMGGDAGMGGSGGMEDRVLLTATVTEAPSIDDKLFDGPPLEGVELCEADTTNCATTNVLGLAEIMVPANEEVAYTVSKEGFVPYFIGDVSEPPSIGSTWPMIRDALMAVEAARVEITWPSDDGLVAVAAFPLQAGVVWDVDDETTTVYYMDEDSIARTDLTETTSTGRGGFYNATAGTRVVDFGGAATNCTPGIAWPGTEANQIRVPVRAGHIGYGSMTCDEP